MTIRELQQTARFLRILAAAEVARLEGDDLRVETLLDSVDPADARALAQRASFDAGVREIYRKTTADSRVRTRW